jgi:hypothetical protein
MDERMLLWGFVGVVLLGLTAVACKQPAVYRRLSLALMPILLCLVFASVGWNFGQTSAYEMLGPHISPDRVKLLMRTFLDAIQEKNVYDAAMLVVIVYLFVLGYVTHILGLKEPPSAAAS